MHNNFLLPWTVMLSAWGSPSLISFHFRVITVSSGNWHGRPVMAMSEYEMPLTHHHQSYGYNTVHHSHPLHSRYDSSVHNRPLLISSLAFIWTVLTRVKYHHHNGMPKKKNSSLGDSIALHNEKDKKLKNPLRPILNEDPKLLVGSFDLATKHNTL